jgi:hypothetical protein
MSARFGSKSFTIDRRAPFNGVGHPATKLIASTIVIWLCTTPQPFGQGKTSVVSRAKG